MTIRAIVALRDAVYACLRRSGDHSCLLASRGTRHWAKRHNVCSGSLRRSRTPVFDSRPFRSNPRPEGLASQLSNPKPKTPDPKPQNPEPETLNPKTLNPKPSSAGFMPGSRRRSHHAS